MAHVKDKLVLFLRKNLLFFFRNLYNNKITQLKENSFRGLSKLRDLIMGNNFIREIPNGAFTGLERLENL